MYILKIPSIISLNLFNLKQGKKEKENKKSLKYVLIKFPPWGYYGSVFDPHVTFIHHFIFGKCRYCKYLEVMHPNWSSLPDLIRSLSLYLCNPETLPKLEKALTPQTQKNVCVYVCVDSVSPVSNTKGHLHRFTTGTHWCLCGILISLATASLR